jgi:hypothetical protein
MWRKNGKQATVSCMALTAFCATCRRTVYIEEEDTAICPVCSSPLVEYQVPEPEDNTSDQGGGA